MAIQLKKEDLIEGKIYECLLSGKTVLVKDIDPYDRALMGTNFKGTDVVGVIYHNGEYKEFEVSHNQLTPLDVVETENGSYVTPD